MKRLKIFLFASATLGILYLTACQEQSAEEIAYKQYFDAGKAWYQADCEKCHQANGEGVAALYPPLANSDYLKQNPEKLACIIYNGLNEEITVNGRTFKWAMPAHTSMDEIEMAQLMTYVLGRWGGVKKNITYENARAAILQCRAANSAGGK